MNLLRRCHECSLPLGKKELFCPRCGAKQPREPKRSTLGVLVLRGNVPVVIDAIFELAD